MKKISLFILLFAVSLLLGAGQILKTSLTITVRDDLGNTVEGAMVKLYENEENYTKEKNHTAEGTTDAKGVLKLKGIRAIAYFVIVRKDDKDNSGGGEKISTLEEGKINKTTIIIQ